LVATSQLLIRAKDGDRAALDALMVRYLPKLRSWASGRLPMFARSLLDTSDLVQDAMLHTLGRLDSIEVQGPTGFQSYVRSAVLNRMRDEIRWAVRRPGPDGVPETIESPAPSPLEQTIGADLVARYECALAALSSDDQRLLHLRIELDYGYDEIMAMTERPSRDAARMAVARALRRLAEAMGAG
jgi:RNA polymerase sigma-70 factor (ECF subfamily)